MAQIDFNVLSQETDNVVMQKVEGENANSGGTDLTYLSEPHVACCILVDTSGSMAGEKIKELNEALRDFRAVVCEDPVSARRVDVCVIEFNTDVRIVTPFCPIQQFNAPTLNSSGGTSMGMGIRYAMEAVHSQVSKYHAAGVECFKPFVLMITDGYPTDDVIGVEQLIAAREAEGRYGHLRFHAFGVQGADMDLLARLTKRVMAIDKNAFSDIFNWASRSMQVISHSRPDNAALGAAPTDNMYAYDPQTKKLPWND